MSPHEPHPGRPRLVGTPAPPTPRHAPGHLDHDELDSRRDARPSAGGQRRVSVAGALDRLGVTHAHAPGEEVTGAIVLLKVVDEDGVVALHAVWSEGLSWLERIGMLREAEVAEAYRNIDRGTPP